MSQKKAFVFVSVFGTYLQVTTTVALKAQNEKNKLKTKKQIQNEKTNSENEKTNWENELTN